MFSMSSWLHASIMLLSLRPLPRYVSHLSSHPYRLDCRRLTAHLFHPIRWRRLPLGLCDSRPPLWPRPWILHRLSQLLRLDIRPRLHRIHPLKRSGTDVRRLPSRLDHRAMARLRCFHPHNLVLLRDCYFREPIAAIVEPDWVVSCYCWWRRDHHRSRSDAEGACSQLGRLG